MAHTAVIDGVNLCYKYHCAPFNTFSAAGVPTGTLYGVLTFLSTFRKKHKTNIVTVWDTERKRLLKWGELYKANRAERGSDAIAEVAQIRQFLSWLGVCTKSVDGYEADDLAYTYLLHNTEPVTLVSSDSDWLGMVQVRSGVCGYDWHTKEYVRYYPYNVWVYKSLRGDKCDNIQAIHGITEAMAMKLARKYTDITSLLRGEALLREHTDALKKNWSLVHPLDVGAKVTFEGGQTDLLTVRDKLARLKFQRKTIDSIIDGIIL